MWLRRLGAKGSRWAATSQLTSHTREDHKSEAPVVVFGFYLRARRMLGRGCAKAVRTCAARQLSGLTSRCGADVRHASGMRQDPAKIPAKRVSAQKERRVEDDRTPRHRRHYLRKEREMEDAQRAQATSRDDRYLTRTTAPRSTIDRASDTIGRPPSVDVNVQSRGPGGSRRGCEPPH